MKRPFHYLDLPSQQRIMAGRQRVVVTRYCPPGLCINLFGRLVTRNDNWISDNVINHELIHTAQLRELWIVPFYLLYLIEWVCKFVRYGSWSKAYRNISFEREAYTYGDDRQYLDHRTPMAWIKYL